VEYSGQAVCSNQPQILHGRVEWGSLSSLTRLDKDRYSRDNLHFASDTFPERAHFATQGLVFGARETPDEILTKRAANIG